MRGHSRSKASIKALVRELPRRIHTKRPALSARLRDCAGRETEERLDVPVTAGLNRLRKNPLRLSS